MKINAGEIWRDRYDGTKVLLLSVNQEFVEVAEFKHSTSQFAIHKLVLTDFKKTFEKTEIEVKDLLK